MKAEILYPEICGLYGDTANIRYLKQCVPDAEIITAKIKEKPYFVNNDVDLLYLGSMSEFAMDIVIKELTPYTERLKELISDNKVILFTGNAMGVTGKYIKENGKTTPCLDLFDFYTERNLDARHNSMFLGRYEDIDIVGCRSQFDFYKNVKGSFISVTKGTGNCPGDRNEGLKVNNMFCTSLLGPFLINNPPFTKKLLTLCNVNNGLAFEKEVFESYNCRLNELKNDNAVILMHE